MRQFSHSFDYEKAFRKGKNQERSRKLNPGKPAQRRQIVEQAVKRTVEEYGKALKKLGVE